MWTGWVLHMTGHVNAVFAGLKVWVYEPFWNTFVLQFQSTRHQWMSAVFGNVPWGKANTSNIVNFVTQMYKLKWKLLELKLLLSVAVLHKMAYCEYTWMQNLQPCPHLLHATSLQLSCWLQGGWRTGVVRRTTVIKKAASWPARPVFI